VHINDGILNPINPLTNTLNITDLAVLVVTWAITVPFLIFAWKKTKSNYSPTIASTLAIMSALIFVIQMLTFQVPGGSSVHILGGTMLGLVLGPYPAMLSMTIVLLMQALFFGDGGFLAFGANALNMAVIGSLSFFMIKLLMRNSNSKSRFASTVFIATLGSAILTALATGLEIGISSTFANAGGIMLTVPTMLSVYAIAGIIEAGVTSVIATALAYSVHHLNSNVIIGLKMLKGKEKP
jgi:cobalt/nickel transport system permease protein